MKKLLNSIKLCVTLYSIGTSTVNRKRSERRAIILPKNFFIPTVYSKSYSLNGQTCFNVSAILECFPHASKRKVIISHPELNFSNYTLRKKTLFLCGDVVAYLFNILL